MDFIYSPILNSYQPAFVYTTTEYQISLAIP